MKARQNCTQLWRSCEKLPSTFLRRILEALTLIGTCIFPETNGSENVFLLQYTREHSRSRITNNVERTKRLAEKKGSTIQRKSLEKERWRCAQTHIECLFFLLFSLR